MRKSQRPQPGALDLLVIGDCNPDVLVLGVDVSPAFGQQEKLVDGISLVVGGSAAITAVAAARLGLRVALAAAIGADPAGEFMLGQLAAEGVDTSAVKVTADSPTGMTVALSRGSDRAILTAVGAMPTLTSADVPAGLLARARHVHVSSYFLLEDSLGPGLAALLAGARRGGATTSLDTNWDPAGHWGGWQLRSVLAHTDVLLPNEAEACHISGKPTLAAAVAALAAIGPSLVVKLGADGAACFDGIRSHAIRPPAGSASQVVDTTGAGDCFNAGLIAGLLDGLELAAAARLGCAVGTASTRGAGGTSAAPDLAAAVALADAVTVNPG
ncbi:MAG: carbohydrate kinase family protein [Streptosporangiaceae bacterium]